MLCRCGSSPKTPTRTGRTAPRCAYLGDEIEDAPDVVKLCSSAFEAVWDRATPHSAYTI
ncbi:DUF6879 family protein [Streptomyces griseolus]|uniref:DUF6879 family protein n=1 Tax=Streptomyces griseolus TaxID=1909 RepID=UPI003908B487